MCLNLVLGRIYHCLILPGHYFQECNRYRFLFLFTIIYLYVKKIIILKIFILEITCSFPIFLEYSSSSL